INGECLREVQQRNIEALEDILNNYQNKVVAIGSHGTALSVIINYYDKSFIYADFERIKMLMPWIVKFFFDGKRCISIEKYNLFEQN
ncbi:MAG: histidine phosphatase family protein, partial [Ruminiclostridium sp.]|nr:histidine phosphatase family protein [Ruminiclostridium sp.]